MKKILVMVHFLDEFYLHAKRPYIVCGSQKNSFLNNFLASREESSKIKRIIPTPTPQPKARDQNSPTELFFSRPSEKIHSESYSPERTIFYNQQCKIPQYETNLIHNAVSFPQANIHWENCSSACRPKCTQSAALTWAIVPNEQCEISSPYSIIRLRGGKR